MAFARRFGDLVTGLEAVEFSNVKRDGSLRDALEEKTRRYFPDLSAYHSLAHSQKELGKETKGSCSGYVRCGLDVENIPIRPLLKIHPRLGANLWLWIGMLLAFRDSRRKNLTVWWRILFSSL